MTYEGKAKLVAYHEKLKGIIDSCGICYFATIWDGPDMPKLGDYTTLLNYATGEEYKPADLLEIGERINNVGKAFNVMHTGLRRKDDYPVDRFFNEPIPSGPMKGAVLERDKWDKMLGEYYAENGWENVNSLPKEETLVRLGLEEVAENLKKQGIL